MNKNAQGEFILLMVFVVAFCCLASSYNHYRLPQSLRPEQYQLRIITHLENAQNLTFEGQVSIRFQALEDTTNITLHAKNLTIDENRIHLKSYQNEGFHLCLEGVETVPEYDYYIIRLCQPLHKDHMYKLTLEFSSSLGEGKEGYYRSSYVDMKTEETRWLSVTHFEPTEARRAFPCFDEPNYKATFVIWLGHHKSLTALSNMPRGKQIPLDERPDYVWSIFEESVPMSTYLVAYSVNDFAHKETHIEGNDVVFRTWCRPDYIEHCSYLAEIAPKFLHYYEEKFGIPFPLKKLDQIAVPDFAENAMENWGLITYNEKKFLCNPNTTSDMAEPTLTISHELAHQWFGNLVTMKWWTDIWLNEGFASYVSRLGVQHVMPELEVNLTKTTMDAKTILKQDNKPNSHPVSQTITKPKEIHERFDEISYIKGSFILRMMHSFLGQEDFFEGVRDYLNKYKYKNAEQDDLWATFSEMAHKNKRIQPGHDVKTIMDSWTLQTGYPLVHVKRNYEKGSIEISQQRFFESASTSTEESHSCWWVPLSYTTSSELDFTTTTPKAWLECDDAGNRVNLTLDMVEVPNNEWLIFNIQLSGMYRVMYDLDNWRLIQETLCSDRFADIPVMNRVQIVEDVLSLAWSGYLSYEIAFDIVEYMSRERSFQPFMAALSHLREVYNILEHFPHELPYLKAYMRNIIQPTYASMDEFKAINETSTFNIFQSLIFQRACSLDLEDCVQAAMELFEQWKLMSDSSPEENNISAYLRHDVYCTAIRNGDYEDWTFLWQRYKVEHGIFDRDAIISSLGCSTNGTLLLDFLDMIFDNDELVAKSDAQSAFTSIASHGIGFPLALGYLADHFREMHENDFDVGMLFLTLSTYVANTEDNIRLNDLYKSNEEYFKDYEAIFNHTFEMINYKIHWTQRFLPDLTLQLRKREYL